MVLSREHGVGLQQGCDWKQWAAEGKAGCSSPPCLVQKSSSSAKMEEGWGQSLVLRRNGCAAHPGPSSVPPCPAVPSAAGRYLRAAKSVWLSREGLDGSELPSQFIVFYLCIYATHHTAHSCCAESSVDLLLFLLIRALLQASLQQVITTKASPSPAAW